MTEFTTTQLATILSALADKQRQPTNKAAAMRGIRRQATAIGRTKEAVLALVPGLLEGWLEPAAWREQLLSDVESGPKDPNAALPDGSSRPVVAELVSSLRPGTKQALIADLMAREQGATLEELIAATGWLPHTTWAALTGLRQKGLALEKSTREGGKTSYRVVTPDPITINDPAPTAVA